MEHIRKIVRVTKDSGKLIVATGDVHHLYKEDKIFREIIVNQKVPVVVVILCREITLQKYRHNTFEQLMKC